MWEPLFSDWAIMHYIMTEPSVSPPLLPPNSHWQLGLILSWLFTAETNRGVGVNFLPCQLFFLWGVKRLLLFHIYACSYPHVPSRSIGSAIHLSLLLSQYETEYSLSLSPHPQGTSFLSPFIVPTPSLTRSVQSSHSGTVVLNWQQF